ncbi:MAG: farnesyl-diphosphate synthase [Cyanobacteria bacterium QS_8_64_29]|nr:MAG: farnesyl-diphosphate synthase [Cyanobacteria bacterium QS_8_64_29]
MMEGSAAPANTAAFDLDAYLAARQAAVERALAQALTGDDPQQIYEAMRYSLLAGGKRLRPILCLASCELVGGSTETAMPTACALEMIHTMSLIHDDLPAMDDDDYRRGQLTNHKRYGEDTAILAGDGLLAHAFEAIAEGSQDVPPSRVVRVVARVGRAVGATGIVGGQAADLAAEGSAQADLDTLHYIHTRKTGALLEACVTSGGILGGAQDSDLERLSRYAYNIGLAFQVIDDILDVTADGTVLGKTAGKDAAAAKATYPSFWGIERSRDYASQLIEGAIAALSGYGERADPLRGIARWILTRQN